MLQLEQDRSSRLAEIRRLEAEISALSSLDRIDRAARERLGMAPARNLQYVTVDVSAPSGPLLPRPLIEATPSSEPESAPWWRSLLRALPLN
jgi:cell division protein FtsL